MKNHWIKWICINTFEIKAYSNWWNKSRKWTYFEKYIKKLRDVFLYIETICCIPVVDTAFNILKQKLLAFFLKMSILSFFWIALKCSLQTRLLIQSLNHKCYFDVNKVFICIVHIKHQTFQLKWMKEIWKNECNFVSTISRNLSGFRKSNMTINSINWIELITCRIFLHF